MGGAGERREQGWRKKWVGLEQLACERNRESLELVRFRADAGIMYSMC